MGGVTLRVTCTWQLLGLAVKLPWLAPGGPILAPATWTCLEVLLSPYIGGSFSAGKAAWAMSGCLTTVRADYCMLINEWA